ncbi:MAG: hypothetical protein FWF55_08905 [Treponema sp.]|nr:hypothetical protein [Treponema sp.]
MNPVFKRGSVLPPPSRGEPSPLCGSVGYTMAAFPIGGLNPSNPAG